METWVIAADGERVGPQIALARGLGGSVTALVVGVRETADALAAGGVDKVIWLDSGEGVPAEAHSRAVADLARHDAPRVVVCGPGPASRVLAAAAGHALGAHPVTGVEQARTDGAVVEVTQLAVGGRLERVLAIPGNAVLFLTASGALEPGPAAVPVEQAQADGTAPVRVVSVGDAGDRKVPLGSAVRVVAAGSGLRAQEDLELVQQLADALGAELGCSLPVAENMGWLPADRVVGLSGAHLTASLYVAVGISGQEQHMEGARDAGTILAINSDPSAPIFNRCDIGVVGDLYQLVPALQAALEAL